MLALPPAPAPAPKRQMFIGTAVAGGFLITMVFSMLGIWLKFRAAAPLAEKPGKHGPIKAWVPKNVVIPEVPANMLWITILAACLFAQYAVYSSRRQDRPNVLLALGLTILMSVAGINAQAVVWGRMDMAIKGGVYQTMFYAITGLTVLLLIVAIVWGTVGIFRSLGGRVGDTELLASHALYWYVLALVFTAVWLVVYVQK